MLWSRRSVLPGLLVGGPVVLAVAMRLAVAWASDRRADPGRAGRPVGLIIWLAANVRFIVPVLGVFYGTPPSSPMRSIDRPSPTCSCGPIERASILVGNVSRPLVCST